jgi:hypothetical protein
LQDLEFTGLTAVIFITDDCDSEYAGKVIDATDRYPRPLLKKPERPAL